MPAPTPPIDKRSFSELVVQTERLLQRYSAWRPAADSNKPGWALVRVFARLAELVIDRLNQVPDKNFFAFLDLVGLDLLPPQPARVPLTFQLAAGSLTDALVPARTPVAAIPAEGDTEPIIFETERELVVTRSQFVFAFTREPGRDLYSDNTAIATGRAINAFPVFQGDRPIEHRLCMGHSGLFGINVPKTITLRMKPAEGDESWLSAVAWAYWDCTKWQPLTATLKEDTAAGMWKVTLPDVPQIPQTAVNDKKSSWLGSLLTTSLPRGDLAEVDADAAKYDLRQNDLTPEAGFADIVPLDFSQRFYPFGEITPRATFYLACDEAFSKPGAHVMVSVDVDATMPARPSHDLVLAWEYWDGMDWQKLGRSSPTDTSISESPYGFSDDTHAFTRDGVIRFRCPGNWVPGEVNGMAGFWVRAHIAAGNYGPATDYGPPVLRRLTLSYKWPLPRIDSIQTQVHIERTDLSLDLGFVNQLSVDLTKDFLPFGEKPKYNDSLYLASKEVFARPTALVTMDIAISNLRRPQASWPIPPVKPSPDLTVAWEYWNEARWAALGSGSPLQGDLLLEPFQTPTREDTLTLKGQRPAGATLVVREQYPSGVDHEVELTDDTWKVRIDELSPGPHAFHITTLIKRDPVDSLWAVAFRTVPKVTPVDLSLAPIPGITEEEKVTIQGRVGIDSGQVLVHNARAEQPVTGEVKDGQFKVDIELQEGRNDLLVLIQDENANWMVGDVVPVVRRRAPAPNDFRDTTWGFTRTGQVSFRLPDNAAEGVVNGEANFWVRARIVTGNYGIEAHYEPVIDPKTGKVVADPDSGLPIYQLVPATFRPPSIQAIALSYDYTSEFEDLDYTLTNNDFTIEDRSQAAKTAGQWFNPYQLTKDTQPTLYLGFQRSGANIGFANRSTALYFSLAEVLYGASPTDGRAVTEPAGVVWEYWNGNRWARLGTHDETQGFTQRGLVTFIGPPDLRRSIEFDREAFWLRARWDHGGYAILPHLRRALTNTMWAAHTLTLQNEILGSSNGEPDQVFRTSKSPVLPGQRVEVREPEMPSTADRATMEDEEGEDAITTVRDPGGRPLEIWVRWHQVSDFYESGPRSRHYTLDRLTGEIRFGDGKRGLVPPQGRANLRAAWYQTGGGPQGNRPAGTITQLKSAVPYVDSVTNLEPSGGGSEHETREAFMNRGPKTLRHRDRALAIEDFEDLAFEASPSVARVRGIPAQGSEDAGSVGLIIVPRSTDPHPIPSLELLDRVEDYIAVRVAPTVDLWVAGPDWLRVTVTAEIVPVSLEAATDVQTAVLARLAAFLHPLTGGLDGNGWAFGRKPYRSDVHALIENTVGVDHVRWLTVTEEQDVRPDRFLVYSGDHQITMVGGKDEFGGR